MTLSRASSSPLLDASLPFYPWIPLSLSDYRDSSTSQRIVSGERERKREAHVREFARLQQRGEETKGKRREIRREKDNGKATNERERERDRKKGRRRKDDVADGFATRLNDETLLLRAKGPSAAR